VGILLVVGRCHVLWVYVCVCVCVCVTVGPRGMRWGARVSRAILGWGVCAVVYYSDGVFWVRVRVRIFRRSILVLRGAVIGHVGEIEECRVHGRSFVALLLNCKMRTCGGDATSKWSMHICRYHQDARHVRQTASYALNCHIFDVPSSSPTIPFATSVPLARSLPKLLPQSGMRVAHSPPI
jgi:hypothetical protein